MRTFSSIIIHLSVITDGFVIVIQKKRTNCIVLAYAESAVIKLVSNKRSTTLAASDMLNVRVQLTFGKRRAFVATFPSHESYQSEYGWEFFTPIHLGDTPIFHYISGGVVVSGVFRCVM